MRASDAQRSGEPDRLERRRGLRRSLLNTGPNEPAAHARDEENRRRPTRFARCRPGPPRRRARRCKPRAVLAPIALRIGGGPAATTRRTRRKTTWHKRRKSGGMTSFSRAIRRRSAVYRNVLAGAGGAGSTGERYSTDENRGFHFGQKAHALVTRAVVPVVIQQDPVLLAAAASAGADARERARSRPSLRLGAALLFDDCTSSSSGLELVVAAQVHERLDVQPPQNQRRVGVAAPRRGSPRDANAPACRPVARREVAAVSVTVEPKTKLPGVDDVLAAVVGGLRPTSHRRSRAVHRATGSAPRAPAAPPRETRTVHSDCPRQARRCQPSAVGTRTKGVIFRVRPEQPRGASGAVYLHHRRRYPGFQRRAFPARRSGRRPRRGAEVAARAAVGVAARPSHSLRHAPRGSAARRAASAPAARRREASTVVARRSLRGRVLRLRRFAVPLAASRFRSRRANRSNRSPGDDGRSRRRSAESRRSPLGAVAVRGASAFLARGATSVARSSARGCSRSRNTLGGSAPSRLDGRPRPPLRARPPRAVAAPARRARRRLAPTCSASGASAFLEPLAARSGAASASGVVPHLVVEQRGERAPRAPGCTLRSGRVLRSGSPAP